ncbi:hypothetical protein J0H58_32950 [bacterium]|nr:hypothetical protein [bacterium]
MAQHHHPEGRGQFDLSGVVRAVNFSPRGGVEGVILDTDRGVVQVNLPPHAAADGFAAGRAVALVVEADPHADRHEPGDHPVYHLVRGPSAGPEGLGRVEGVVARLNYARHGEPNGVVLDTGDFVHLKPHGMREVGLAVGDRVTAEGPTRPSATGHRAVEAVVVNGVRLAPGKHPH